MEFWPILKGLATWLPFLYDARRGTTGGTSSSRYCYSVWMRHWTLVRAAGLGSEARVVAELGPGDSLGIGLAALLSGATELRAFDVVRYAASATNRRVLGELVELFRNRADIPDDVEFPGIFPRLECYRFPTHLWTDEALSSCLAPARVAMITEALDGRADGPIRISYLVPWDAVDESERASVDMVYSQAVLEHVAELSSAYVALGRWVRPGGVMSHTIDFGSHRITATWDGHRQYSDAMWSLVCGARPYLLNRAYPQEHIDGIARNGFRIRAVSREACEATIADRRLATRFKELSAPDRATRSMHVIAERMTDGILAGSGRD